MALFEKLQAHAEHAAAIEARRAINALATQAREPGHIVDDTLVWPKPFHFDPAPPTPEAIAKQMKK